MTLEIPEVDVSGFLAGDPEASRIAARDLATAFEEVGFFYLVGHGVPWSMVDRTYEWARQVHELPLDVKQRYAVNSEFGGYLGLATTASAASAVAGGRVRKPNLNEAWLVQPEELDFNQWPPLEGVQEEVDEYFRTIRCLAYRLLPLVAQSLDLPPDWFQSYFDDDFRGSLRLSHYPVVDHEDGQYGIDAHTDNGFLTFLPDNPTSGLWIRPVGAEWTEAPSVPGAFVVNTGNTLARWTNDRYVATPHRVLNESGRDRYAIPFFYPPKDDCVVAPISTCVTADRPAKYEPMRFGDLRKWFLSANYGFEPRATV